MSENKKMIPMPTQRTPLEFRKSLSRSQYEILTRGFKPRDMDDKWGATFENGWLYVYRSWTGFCIFMLHLSVSGERYEVIESWVNRDVDQYKSIDLKQDQQTLSSLIESFLAR